MGRTAFVTITAKEYAMLQRIVGSAECTIRIVPSMWDKEMTTLRGVVAEYLTRYGKSEANRA